jgi:hypothetical protein
MPCLSVTTDPVTFETPMDRDQKRRAKHTGDGPEESRRGVYPTVVVRASAQVKTKFSNVAAALRMSEGELFARLWADAEPGLDEQVRRREAGGPLVPPTDGELREAVRQLAREAGGRNKEVVVDFADLYSARGCALHLLLDALWGKEPPKSDAALRRKLVDLFDSTARDPKTK